MEQLRIALIAPPWFSVPPTGYGGIEWVVSLLADGLTQRGHDVTLFASGGSRTPAKLVSVYQTPPSARLGDWVTESVAVAAAYGRADEFDIIHDHTLLGMMAAPLAPVPVVHTVHGQVIPPIAALYRAAAGKVHFVAISSSQAATMPAVCEPTVIYNATDVSRFPFRARPGEYLLFVGRMSEEKGILPAIEIARRSGRLLVVLAKINEPAEREYFERYVEPAMAGAQIEFHEQAAHEVKVAAYRHALATLFPIAWPEPFGLVMTESMACGTPVIAFRHGSVPEVIVDGKTGIICDTVDEAVQAIERVRLLKREDCRIRVEEHFGAERNIERHERLYRQILEGRREPKMGAAGIIPAMLPVPVRS